MLQYSLPNVFHRSGSTESEGGSGAVNPGIGNLKNKSRMMRKSLSLDPSTNQDQVIMWLHCIIVVIG